MNLILAIGVGSFFGGIFRYLLAQFIQAKFLSNFPLGTLIVNVTGCLFIGIIFSLNERIILPQEWRLLLITGVLGGFTTFSAFSMETINMMRDGQLLYAIVYILTSIIVCLFATYAGMLIFNLINYGK